MKPVAIVGGGITGLSAAYTLHKQGLPLTLFEASSRFGGALYTANANGVVVEHGADSWVSYEPAAAELARELGLGDQLMLSNDAERTTYIVRSGRLVEMPRGLRLFVPTDVDAAMASPLFSDDAKQRIRQELDFAPYEQYGDVSIAAFAERHFGKEVVATLVEPLLAGVYGGDASRLSAQAVIPAMLEAERTRGSLIRTMQGTPAPGSIFSSLRTGMSALADALVAKLPAQNLRLNTPVEAITRHNDSWQVDGETFSALLITTPAYVAARLLEPTNEELAATLREFTYTDAISVSLIYDRAALRGLPAGFGLLVPKDEQREILACTFVHQKWPEKVAAEKALLRVFITAGIERDAETLTTIAQKALRELLGITAIPQRALVHRWRQAMPQYAVGHIDRIKRLMQLCGQHRVSFAGSTYRGIGVSHCVRQGAEAAQKISERIQHSPSD